MIMQSCALSIPCIPATLQCIPDDHAGMLRDRCHSTTMGDKREHLHSTPLHPIAIEPAGSSVPCTLNLLTLLAAVYLRAGS